MIPPEDAVEPTADDDAAQLLSRFRSGDRAAGYELLGRQASLDQWKAALTLFTSDSADIDLERIAGSTLGRHPEVVAAVIDLLAASGSAQALFISHATAALRVEPHLVERARDVERALFERRRELLENVDEGLAALYTLISLPLTAQRDRWMLWREAAPDNAAVVEQALEAEDDRLQRLSKERSYRAGTYLHFLRHTLADLVLVAGIGGSIGKRAFALLQRRVDDADRQEALLLAAPDEVSRRYIDWALEPRNAEAVPRTRFALRMAREHYPEAVGADRIVALCGAPDAGVCLDAALTGIAVGIESRAFDLELTRLITALDPGLAQHLARAAVKSLTRIDLAQIDPHRRSLLLAAGADAPPEFWWTMARQLLNLPPSEIRDMVGLLAATPASDLPNGLLAEVAAGLLRLGRPDTPYWPVLVDSLNEADFRAAVWGALPSVADDHRGTLASALIEAEKFEDRAPRVLDVIHATDPDTLNGLTGPILSALFDGKLDLDAMAASWPDDLRSAALAAAEETRRQSEGEREQIEEQIRLGERAYLAELWQKMAPLIELASSRAAGNARLEDGYARLAATLSTDSASATPAPEAGAAASPATEIEQSVQDELERVGGRFDSARGTILFDLDRGDASARLRYLGVLDQRAHRAGASRSLGAGAQRLLRAYTDALGPLGIAEDALRQLFSGGPLLPTVVQLSPSTREALLKAAQTNGLERPSAWLEHPALGDWLRAVELQADRAPSDDEPDAATLHAAFKLAHQAREARNAAQYELDQQRHTVKEAVARDAGPLFEEIDALIDSYAQLWHGFARLGIRQIAPLGLVITRDGVDADRHEIVGEADAATFIVRTPGVEVDGDVLARARLEGIAD